MGGLNACNFCGGGAWGLEIIVCVDDIGAVFAVTSTPFRKYFGFGYGARESGRVRRPTGWIVWYGEAGSQKVWKRMKISEDVISVMAERSDLCLERDELACS